MFRRSLILPLAALLFATTAHAQVGTDKYLHAGASAIIASGVTLLAADSPNRLWYGIGASVAVGVAKELVDRREPGNRFSSKDVLADVLGAVAGAYLTDRMLRPVVARQPRGYALGMQLTVPLK